MGVIDFVCCCKDVNVFKDFGKYDKIVLAFGLLWIYSGGVYIQATGGPMMSWFDALCALGIWGMAFWQVFK